MHSKLFIFVLRDPASTFPKHKINNVLFSSVLLNSINRRRYCSHILFFSPKNTNEWMSEHSEFMFKTHLKENQFEINKNMYEQSHSNGNKKRDRSILYIHINKNVISMTGFESNINNLHSLFASSPDSGVFDTLHCYRHSPPLSLSAHSLHSLHYGIFSFYFLSIFFLVSLHLFFVIISVCAIFSLHYVCEFWRKKHTHSKLVLTISDENDHGLCRQERRQASEKKHDRMR